MTSIDDLIGIVREESPALLCSVVWWNYLKLVIARRAVCAEAIPFLKPEIASGQRPLAMTS